MAEPESGDRFDYIIVGAGSAGCVLANRLSEDPNVTVAVLEAGGKNDSLLVKMPAGVGNLIAAKGVSNWAFETTPQQFMDGRRLYQPRGRGWGGSSSINGMIYIRGPARDYDQWRQMGLTGWGYADVLPYFKRSQLHEDGADRWNAEGGPLWVSRGPPGHPIYKAFIKPAHRQAFRSRAISTGANRKASVPITSPSVTANAGARPAAYLKPVIGRPNLKVISGAYAHRILIENKKVIGVEFSAGPGKPAQNVYAKREVLVCGGAFQSPQLLQLSGIGPGAELQRHGINVVHEAPDVGRNLQDHLDVCVIYDMTKPVSMYSLTKGLKQPMIGIEYMLSKQGHGRTNH